MVNSDIAKKLVNIQKNIHSDRYLEHPPIHVSERNNQEIKCENKRKKYKIQVLFIERIRSNYMYIDLMRHWMDIFQIMSNSK